MIRIVIALFRAFPALARIAGKALSFYREQEARKRFETKINTIDSAIDELAGIRVPNGTPAGDADADGSTRLSGSGESRTRVDKGSS